MSAIYFCFNVGSNINWNTSNMNLVMSALCYSNIIQNVIKFTHRNNCMNEHKYKYKINNKQTNSFGIDIDDTLWAWILNERGNWFTSKTFEIHTN